MKFFNIKISFQKIALFLCALLGIIYIHYTWTNAENSKFNQTLQIARSIAATLPKEDLKVLEAKPDDINKPQYKTLKNTLKETIRTYTKARFSYLFKEQNGKIYFIADSEPEDSKDYSPPGQEFTEADQENIQQFRDGKERIADNTSDRWGTWTSVLIPIIDENTGKTIAVFGIDFNAKSWDKSVFIEVIESSALIALLILVLLFLFRIKANNKLLKHDIVEIKRSQDELQFRNIILSTQLESSIDGILIVDENAKIISCNNRFMELWGVPQLLLANNDNEQLLEFIRNKTADPNTFRLRVLYLHEHKHETGQDEIILKNGKIFDRYSAPMVGVDKRYYGRIWYFRDITNSKQAKQALQTSRKQLRDIIEFLPDATLAIDNEKRIIIWNKAIEDMTGIPGTDMIGKGDYAYTIPFFGEPIQQLMDLVFHADIGIAAVYHNIFREGDTINAEVYCKALYNNKGAWLLAKVSPLYDNSGNIIGAIESLRDITESKKAQQELINAKEQAEESNKLKTEFLNNISHEIRTPFNGILGFLSILEDNNLTVSERSEYTGIINKSAFRLMNTINDIVETSQIQAGQIKLSVAKTNIRKLTNELYNKFKSDAEDAGLKLYISNDLPVSVEYINTDYAKLNSILTILIGNAVKFTKTGSIGIGIKLNTDDNTATDCRDGLLSVSRLSVSTLEFSVKDTGIGIPKNKQSTIFERFIQADGSNTRSFEGSGLGLSIAKAYVEMLGGNIWVESQEGKGAEFRFTILYNDKQEEKTMIENAVSLENAKNLNYSEISELKVLIVEDDEGSALLIEMAVRKIVRKEILLAKTGIEAVEACRRNPDIDLVFMDIKMPGIDGYEATKQIRQFNTSVVIIAQTAYALTGDRERAIAAGCNDYISKPIKKEILFELMQNYFNK